MKPAKVTSETSGPYRVPDDWEDGECLCEGKIPEGKRLEYINRVFRERDNKWVNKVWLRCHTDCPIHGCNPDTRKKD